MCSTRTWTAPLWVRRAFPPAAWPRSLARQKLPLMEPAQGGPPAPVVPPVCRSDRLRQLPVELAGQDSATSPARSRACAPRSGATRRGARRRQGALWFAQRLHAGNQRRRLAIGSADGVVFELLVGLIVEIVIRPSARFLQLAQFGVDLRRRLRIQPAQCGAALVLGSGDLSLGASVGLRPGVVTLLPKTQRARPRRSPMEVRVRLVFMP